MANDVAQLVKSKYTKGVQALLEENLIAMDIARVDLRADMPDGNTLNYPRPVYSNTANYTKYTDVSDTDLDFTNEQLVINQTPYVSFVFDEVDNLDTGYEVVVGEMRRNAFRLKQFIEGKLFAEYSNADNGTGDSSTALGTTIGTDHPVTIYGDALASLRNDGVDTSNLVIVADPHSVQDIGEAALGNTYNVADEHYKRGYRGDFLGANLYESPNLTATTSLAVGTNPTADDTVTINGVTFTFKAAPSASGEVDIGASAAASVDNLVAAINNDNGYAAGAGSATAYYEVSKANRAKLQGITATDGTTSVDIVSNRGYRPVSQTMTAAADDWDAVVIWNLVMEKGSIDIVLQKEVSSVIKDIPTQLGKRFITWTRFGIKTFSEGAERMYALPITAAGAEA